MERERENGEGERARERERKSDREKRENRERRDREREDCCMSDLLHHLPIISDTGLIVACRSPLVQAVLVSFTIAFDANGRSRTEYYCYRAW